MEIPTTPLRLGSGQAAAFIVAFMASTVPAFAHHGGGTFDLSQSVTYTGKLTRVELVNPHSWLYFDVTDANGRVSHHRCEMRSVHVLRRSGWTKELFPVGQQITVEAAPDKVDPNSCYLNTIRLENGSHMDRYGQYVKAPEGAIREVRGPSFYRTPHESCGVPPASRTSRATGRRSRSSWSIPAGPGAAWCRLAD